MTGTRVGVEELVARRLDSLARVGAKRVGAFEELEIFNLWDLITYFPRRYLDRSKLVPVTEAVPGEQVLLLGRIRNVAALRSRGRAGVVEASLVDESGSIRLTFFHQPYRSKQLSAINDEVAVFGRVELFRHRRQMVNPIVDVVGDQTGRVVPIYPLRERAGVSSREIARLVRTALSEAGEFADPIPPIVRGELELIGRTDALTAMHFPDTMDHQRQARRRIAFDELFRLQVILGLLREARDAASVGIVHDVAPFGPGSAHLVSGFLGRLPYALTGGQRKAIEAIASDMSLVRPMHRLLQGDVGSGKTLVALVAMLLSVQSGHQAVLLAPTEVLAEQHFQSLTALLKGAALPEHRQEVLFHEGDRPVAVRVITGSVSATRRRQLLVELANGSVDLIVGTHALLSEGVNFRSLGLLVVDEQHRFGVEQRSLLRDRVEGDQGTVPDTLVMTATPIPRTAAMTVYGDLDLSVIDELPPGRSPIVTKAAMTPTEIDEAFRHAGNEIAQGRQVYVVCSLVEESLKLQAVSVTAEFERLQGEVFPHSSVGLLHGRMSSREKEEAMVAFREGRTDVLVATTVIEVGVDVPNATMMLIEDAGRFGIAQLHQLRGRVGRGAHRSYCYLIGEAEAEIGRRRIQALVDSSDGFALAEVDLELRGEGTVLGSRQAGRSDLRVASIMVDRDLVEEARHHARELLKQDSTLGRHPRLAAELRVIFDDDEVAFLLRG
ncbi:MAG: ATP-dependent DNA helicase RecG [Ferrimicrobium sp.]